MEEIENKQKNINHAQILAMITDGKDKHFYTRIRYEDFTYKDVRVQLDDMKELGVAKTIASHKKVANWFDTDEGIQWLSNKFKEMVC